ncbi:hypothetical protein HDU82_006531 [Entophlyctis luteolus]|nr:hypothetical protein HDU82_006531 [Entophlyctis luteolus]
MQLYRNLIALTFLLLNGAFVGISAYIAEARVKVHPLSSEASSLSPSRYRVAWKSLPWADGSKPITNSFAGLIDIRSFPDGWQESFEKPTEQAKAKMFFWYFPAEKHPDKEPAPLIIWLQGGPGSSSNIGLFYEMGPLRLTSDLKLYRNNQTWAASASMLFIDNPVGTGYSKVDPVSTGDSSTNVTKQQNSYSDGYVTDQKSVGRDLTRFLERFYGIFPEQRLSRLFIAGESYAGKYIPAFAEAIISRNRAAKQAILETNSQPSLENITLFPLSGIAIGNGLTDPVSQIKSHAPLALAFGLVNDKQAVVLDKHASEAIDFANAGRWREATASRNRLFEAFKAFSGNINPYDIRKGSVQNSWILMETFLNLNYVKKALNVPTTLKFEKDPKVAEMLFEDGMKSMKNTVSHLLSSNRWSPFREQKAALSVLLYQGQFDFRDGILSSSQWISSLEWSGSEGFNSAERNVWEIEGKVAGYVTEFAQLKRIEILLAGHLSPQDAPVATKKMIEHFIATDSIVNKA